MLPDGTLPDETTQAAAASHGRYGVALVEIALVLPFFLAVVGGVTALGRAAIVTQALHDAARAGTRQASQARATNESVRTATLDSLVESTALTGEDVSLQIRIAPASGNEDPSNEVSRSHPKDRIHVRIQLEAERVGWLARLALQGAPLTGESQVQRE